MRRAHLRWLAAAASAAAFLAVPAHAGANGTKPPDRCAKRPAPNVNFRGCDFARRQLAHVNLSGADLAGANFTSASLFDAVLFGANLSGATLTDANLVTANFTGAKLNHATIEGATVVQATFQQASLVELRSGGVRGRPAHLPGRFFMKHGLVVGPGVDLSYDSLAHFDLHHANLSRANLAHANLSGANLSHASLAGTDLVGAILTGATIEDTGFHDAVLFKPNRPGVRSGHLLGKPRRLPPGFVMEKGYLIGPGADLYRADLARSFLPGVNLTAADLDDANFDGAVLWGADFSITALQHTGFVGASLRNASFSNVSLTTAHLSDVVLTGVRSSAVASSALPRGWVNVRGHLVGPGANLTGNDLSGGHFQHAVLTGANLRGANLTGSLLTYARLAGSVTGHLIVHGAQPKLPGRWHLFRGYLLGPGAFVARAQFQNSVLRTIDLASAELDGTDLQNANLSRANLTHAVLLGVNVQHANLSRAALGGIVTRGLIGRPASLPPHWALVGGTLVRR